MDNPHTLLLLEDAAGAFVFVTLTADVARYFPAGPYRDGDGDVRGEISDIGTFDGAALACAHADLLARAGGYLLGDWYRWGATWQATVFEPLAVAEVAGHA